MSPYFLCIFLLIFQGKLSIDSYAESSEKEFDSRISSSSTEEEEEDDDDDKLCPKVRVVNNIVDMSRKNHLIKCLVKKAFDEQR